MRILKHGNSDVLRNMNHFVQFNCSVCWCIFEADSTEYTRNFHYALNNVVESGFYATTCPDCHKMVFKAIPAEEVQAYERERTQGNS